MAPKRSKADATVQRVRRKARLRGWHVRKAPSPPGKAWVYLYDQNGNDVWPAEPGEAGSLGDAADAEAFLDLLADPTRPDVEAAHIVGGAAAVEAMRTEQPDESSLKRWERDGTADYDEHGNERPKQRR